jgi:ATP-dependent phosphoenolpyruvate carboxykinase
LESFLHLISVCVCSFSSPASRHHSIIRYLILKKKNSSKHGTPTLVLFHCRHHFQSVPPIARFTALQNNWMVSFIHRTLN